MTPFTIDFLATQGGIVAAILILVEVAKWLFKLKDQATVLRMLAVSAGVALSIAVLPTFTVLAVVVAALNGLVCALAAMKGYELGSPAITNVISKLWYAEEKPDLFDK